MAMGSPDELTPATRRPDPAAAVRGWASRPYEPTPPLDTTSADMPSVDAPPAHTPGRDDAPANLAPMPATAPWSLSLTGWLLLGTVAVVMATTTFAIPAWTAARASPRVVLLGCGSALSVLIQSGDARVVIAAGDEPADFGTAFGQATALAGNRIDLLVVGATGKGLGVPADVARDTEVRRVVRLGSPHPGRETGDLPPGLPQLPGLARIDVAPGLTATIETVEIPKPNADLRGDFDLAWRAQVRFGAATVTVLSDAKVAAAFPPLTSHGVLVVASDPGRDDLGALFPTTAGALVVNAETIEGSEIRADVPPLIANDLPTVRVHQGTAVTLRLTEAGVELPRDDVVVVRPSREGAA